MRIFVRGDVVEWDHFDDLELEFCIKTEQDGIGGRIGGRLIAPEEALLRTGAVRNVNIFLGELVSIQVERQAAENEKQGGRQLGRGKPTRAGQAFGADQGSACRVPE